MTQKNEHSQMYSLLIAHCSLQNRSGQSKMTFDCPNFSSDCLLIYRYDGVFDRFRKRKLQIHNANYIFLPK